MCERRGHLASTTVESSTPRVRTPNAGSTGRGRAPLEPAKLAGGAAQLGSSGRMGTNTTDSQPSLPNASLRSLYLHSLQHRRKDYAFLFRII